MEKQRKCLAALKCNTKINEEYTIILDDVYSHTITSYNLHPIDEIECLKNINKKEDITIKDIFVVEKGERYNLSIVMKISKEILIELAKHQSSLNTDIELVTRIGKILFKTKCDKDNITKITHKKSFNDEGEIVTDTELVFLIKNKSYRDFINLIFTSIENDYSANNQFKEVCLGVFIKTHNNDWPSLINNPDLEDIFKEL